ncbi:dephospho-CoA kinase [Pseudohongiella sp. SYSU M77423]|uniref:dephospho-CoA kinase n=1 Tax=unclassified Pseudohongiella TaxID=2629611 RepID=UPI001EED48ED|nr:MULTISPECIES: dephospho-CoA kinase [unclassified Pseudohongiella]MDH7944560.1 dephospho-CoA kinase [Pseudohongiella sp. SYSU M77423]
MTQTLESERLIIGLTGGIGSGKSAATRFFSELGITVVDADELSREVVKPGEPALQAIVAHFGDGVLLDDGQLDRRQLRQRIFDDHNERKWLEQLLHPLIRQEIISRLTTSTSPYTLLSSPLLLETDQQRLCSRVLLIDAPESLQIERTIVRDNSSEATVKAIMESQMARHARIERADDIIVNDGDLNQLKDAVTAQHQRYLEMTQ